MSYVFDIAVRLAEEGIADLGPELTNEIVQRGTEELEIIPTLLCSIPADPDSPVGEYVECSLRVATHWDMATTAEKVCVVAFLDVVAEMVADGKIIPQAVYGPED